MTKSHSPLVIFQNYFSPYRHKLFIEIAKHTDLLVVYMQKPHEEGRQWDETSYDSEKNYQTIQLENKRLFPFGPLNKIVWVIGLKKLQTQIPRQSKVIYLDNMPTNLTTLRLMGTLSYVPRKDRILWNEHISASGSDSFLKNIYKKVMTFLLAVRVDTILSFSEMTNGYLKSLSLPLTSQEIVRTIQATYLESEIDSFKQSKSKKLTFGFLGYFSDRKGIREMLDAFRYYKNPLARMLFVGDGPLKAEIAKARLSDNRIILENYARTEEEKTEYFNQMSFNIVASEKDPWCVVVNEAASRGVPSIVSPYVGASEIVKLVTPEFVLKDNSAMSFAKAFVAAESLFQDEAVYQTIQKKTHKIAKLWNIERASEIIVSLTEKS